MAALAALPASSCYSSNYRAELQANTALLAELADKLEDYCRAGFEVGGRQISPEEMGEFYYALSKARSWGQITQRRAGGRQSYRAFMELLDDYDALVRDADRYRLDRPRDPARLAALAREHDAVRRRAGAVIAALGREHG
ncbi:MAG: hypothetical protein WA005_04775 [Candidatus Binataceae bacterium]